MKEKKRTLLFIILLMTVLIALTRAVSLEHGLAYHPDEHVFFESAASLKDHLLDASVPFEESKEYPEGAYVLQAPFHVLGEWLNLGSAAVWGRVASVFYFALGCVIGCLTLYRFFGQKKEMALAYALLMTFGMLHIEQSRYGTGEAISFFLLMILVYACAAGAARGEKAADWRWLTAAGVAAGAMGAVKYPQVYFALCPFAVCLHDFFKSRRKGAALARLLGMILAVVLGVLIFSPKAAADPMYFVRVCQRELGAYVFDGDISEMGGKLNHIVSLLLYHTLYADLPLALPAAAVVVLAGMLRRKQNPDKDGADFFLRFVLPVLTAIFALYNLMVKSLFFRTLYPYFCVMALYTAAGCGRWLEAGGWKRVVTAVLCAVLVGRGCVMAATFADNGAPERVLARIEEIMQEDGWRQTIRLRPGTSLRLTDEIMKQTGESIHMDYIPVGQVQEIEPGSLVVTESLNYGRAGEYMLPIGVERFSIRIANWKQFKEINEPYLVMEAFPEWYYWYSGYWIKGSTGAEYEYPAFRLYYRPAE